MDDDDLLREILLRLPPMPSTLPRVSLVCKRWRRLVADAAFLRRFRAHHRRAPAIGFFSTFACPVFNPALDPPDRIPAERFLLRLEEGDHYKLLGCRHGRALLLNSWPQHFLLVWNPVTGDQTRVDVPPEFNSDKVVILTGALICTGGDRGHAHGDCHSASFQAALLATDIREHTQLFASVYTSETGKWSEIISPPFIRTAIELSPAMRIFQPVSSPTILIGNSVCWSYALGGACIVEFDLDKQKIALTEPPPDANAHSDTVYAIMRAEEGGLGLIVVSDFRAQLWKKRKVSDWDDDAPIWVLGRTVDLDKLLSLGAAGKRKPLALVGFDDENNVTLVRASSGVFTVHLQSMSFQRLCNSGNARTIHMYHAFPSFFATGSGVGDGHGEALHHM
ncbi:hypothetical protein QYE76_003243 [Lolium multiflorum]|uniref:F-box domain-containing protein n=1 Tax=Lolium multiflorum TaxID=4521 RepID=A0AAD8RPS5_LOLMU|nr:hypothetical protein QYE76_003243 [Lolium multiflorum]